MHTRNTLFWKWSVAAALSAALGALSGCADQPEPSDGDGEFISDSPFGGGKSNGGGGEASGSGGGGGGGPVNDGSDAEKAIVEADVIQVDGDHLFALSQYGGLTVVDMSNPSQLSILGRYRVQGVPFEMYLREGVVYAMFSSFGQWLCDADYESCEYVSSSHIEALDVSNPGNIVKIGSFDLPGEISDSRIVGDVLYAVSYENGYCWNCDEAPRTVVTSIHVADPDDIGVVDSVSFTSNDVYGYGWWRRSVTVTPDRMYVAGIEWDGDGEGGSTIQIVDISDPTGQLHVGASVEATGMIESRWQMDEKDGTLRVISQPGLWSNGVPTVQTFQIESSDSIVPLAALDLVLPKPERLRSARFDGDRLYAITAEQTDPLFTIDVSNPSQPVQMGELEMPGWIYHMEPRGDRLFALGFDEASQEGSMHVSLFDVSDMSAPTLLKRVAFGGTWSWAAEDQNRIHKAFKIDSALGAIFVPYGAYSYEEDGGHYGCWQMESGIQIVDFTQDDLVKRGTVPLNGFARRALVHEGKLFSISDAEVGAYDITNRDAPARLDEIALSAWSNQALRTGDKIVRVSSDWWTNAARLDVVPANDPNRVQPIGSLDLTEVVSDDDASCYGWGYFYGAQVFALSGGRVALTWSSYDWYYEGGGGAANEGTHVVVVNVSNPAAPAVEGKLKMPFSVNMGGWWGSIDGGKAVVQIGDRLVFRRVKYAGQNGLENAWLEVVDLTSPGSPKHAQTIPLPDGYGHSLLIRNGNSVMTSHWKPLQNDASKVKFYLDRVFFATNGTAAMAPSLNVPGALVSFDAGSQHALTIDFRRVQIAAASAQDCYESWGSWSETLPGVGACTYMQQSLKLIDTTGSQVDVLDTHVLDQNFYVYGTQVTDSRVFLQGYSYDPASGHGAYTVLVAGDIADDDLAITNKSLPGEGDYLWIAAAQDDYAVMASYNVPGIHVLDASDMGAITIEKKADVSAYVYGVTLDGDRALCSMGPYGLEAVDLE